MNFAAKTIIAASLFANAANAQTADQNEPVNVSMTPEQSRASNARMLSTLGPNDAANAYIEPEIVSASSSKPTIATNLPEIVDLTPEDRIELDVSAQSKIVQCAVQAVSESKLPNAEMEIAQREVNYSDNTVDKRYEISKSKVALFPKEGAEGTTLNYDKPNAIEVPGYDLHNISVEIAINSKQTQIDFSAYHNGSYNATVDAANASISADIAATGLTNRSGGAIQHSDEWGVPRKDPTTTAHGQWVITAVQSLEHRFNSCMGFSGANRPASAATTEQTTPYKVGVPQASIPQLNREP